MKHSTQRFSPLARFLIGGFGLSMALTLPCMSQAQAPIVYPSQGQSLEQQSKDEGACLSWAQQQTGFNPSMGVQSVPTSQGGGEVARGAVGGALVGAVGGAIGGDTGKGAAIGAGVGATAGLLGRRQKKNQTAEAQQQAVANYNAGVAQYNRAFAACMSGRGYTVN